MTTRRMRIECWITKATHTLTICNIYCLPTATSAEITRLNIMLYVHCRSFQYSYAINILVCILRDNGVWRKQRVGGNKELYLYVCCICRCWFVEGI
jgi:hypothetical protein